MAGNGYSRREKLTLTPDGRIDITYKQAGTPKRSGTYTADSSTIMGIFENGETTDYHKKSGALSRQELPVQEAVSTVDAILAGTWEGIEGSVYEEITLYGDGTYVKFVPEDEALCQKGTYMANGSHLAVLLPDGALQGTYTFAGEELTVTWQNAEPLKLIKKTGPLTRLAQTGE